MSQSYCCCTDAGHIKPLTKFECDEDDDRVLLRPTGSRLSNMLTFSTSLLRRSKMEVARRILFGKREKGALQLCAAALNSFVLYFHLYRPLLAANEFFRKNILLLVLVSR